MKWRADGCCCNIWWHDACLNTKTKLVHELSISRQVTYYVLWHLFNLARYWLEGHHWSEPDILDNPLADWSRPSIRSRCRPVKLRLNWKLSKLLNVMIPTPVCASGIVHSGVTDKQLAEPPLQGPAGFLLMILV